MPYKATLVNRLVNAFCPTHLLEVHLNLWLPPVQPQRRNGPRSWDIPDTALGE